MTAQIITGAELVEYGSRSLPMQGFADAKIAEAVLQATDRIRQAALNDYTPESFELLTTANCPDELRELALAIGLHIITRGDAGRPASIDDAYDDASRRLGYIAAGKTYYDKSPNAVMVKAENGAGSTVSYSSVARSFDAVDDCSDYRKHFRKLP
jgi:hypothetical protein